MALNISGLPKVPMNIIFMAMFVLATWASIGYNWLEITHILSNYVVVVVGILCEHDKVSPVPVQMFFFGTLFTLLNDIILIGIHFQGTQYAFEVNNRESLFNFNAACAIILILAKPVAAFFIYREWLSRVNGDTAVDQSDYNSIDNNGGYGSSAPAYGGQSGYGNQPGYSEKSNTTPQYQPPTQPYP